MGLTKKWQVLLLLDFKALHGMIPKKTVALVLKVVAFQAAGFVSYGHFFSQAALGGDTHPSVSTDIRRGLLYETIRLSTFKVYGSGSPGSAVVIGREQGTYYALTAAHAIKGTELSEGPFVMSVDGKKYPITRIINGVYLDLSEIWFSSADNYRVAKMGRVLRDGTPVVAAGFPVDSNQLRISDRALSNSQALANIPASTPNGRPGGYGLRHTALTEVGMSGGGVWSESGLLLGIHGQADIYSSPDQENVRKTGGSLAVPVSFYALALRNGGLERATAQTFPPLRSAGDFALQAKYLTSIGDLKQSVKFYTAAIVRSPGNPDYWSNRGNVKVLQGEFKEAISDYRRALVLSPNNPVVLVNMSSAAIGLGDNNLAENLLMLSLKYGPTNPAAWVNLVRVYRATGQVDKLEDAESKARLYRRRDI